MKPKTLIAASCAACLLVLLTPGVISQDEPCAAGRPSDGVHYPESGPRLRPELWVDPALPEDGERAGNDPESDRR